MPSPNNSYIEEGRSSLYDAVSERYSREYLQGHAVDITHYEKVRSAYLLWMQKLRDNGVKAEEGTSVICGPGWNVANHRDFDPVILESCTSWHPRIIIADFSRDVLLNACHSLTNACQRITREKLFLARRDFSGGISARFDALLQDRIDSVETAGQLEDFMLFIDDQSVDTIKEHQLSDKGDVEAHNFDVQAVDGDEGLCFKNITRDVAEVRFFIANMVLEGMNALTEGDFREKLMEIEKREKLSPELVANYLERWHRLILDLNNHIAANFIRSALSAHPTAHILTTNAVDVSYEKLPMDSQTRLSSQNIQSQLKGTNIKITASGQWTAYDSGETPPHSHTLRVWEAKVNGGDHTTSAG